MGTVMSITHGDAGDAVNAEGVDSILVRQRVSGQKPLVGAYVAGAVHWNSLEIKTSMLSLRPRDFDKASATKVGSRCRCGFHVRHA
jgi:hypothetical protein